MTKNQVSNDEIESPLENRRLVFEAAVECGVLEFMAGIASMTGNLSAAVIEYTNNEGQLIRVGYGKHGGIEKSVEREFLATGFTRDRVIMKSVIATDNKRKSYK
ncbi:hypothetical protein EIJ81_01010 (plasmid) [Aliivibrio salmonicida]|uniref:hypothetical protein n=1 Tax=Aliivibrio salmonicida TaxID=40269 RepID=UPI000F6E936B|nr:hypothetical protein [Aliivibrio salmonicida]AZL83479.1 hypothetical protein EIJ81_01010 [Aliivibrio salmonicida]